MGRRRSYASFWRALIALGLLLLVAGCWPQEPDWDALVDGYVASLAGRWAPIHYQDVHRDGTWSLGGRSDLITAVDYDGDWDTSNNWENLAPHLGHEAIAHGYYSVVLTETHAFILYAFYHPRDWDRMGITLEAHENDMEGLLAVVELPGRVGSTGFDYQNKGVLKAIVTVFHRDFYSYSNWDIGRADRFEDGMEDIDGRIRFRELTGKRHPVTAQEAGGHGLKSWPDVDITEGDGVVYYPTPGKAEEPDYPDDRRAQYALVSIFTAGGLWDHRHDEQTFASYGVFRGDTYGSDKANAPWYWDDTGGPFTNGDSVAAGVIATDPATLVKVYFSNLGDFSTTYILNPYQGIEFSPP